MTKLEELHDAVKLHPYRLTFDRRDIELKYDYNNLLRTLLKEFWSEAMRTPYLEKASSSLGNFYHDFLSVLLHRGDYTADEIIHVERCIACIHNFIRTGRVDEFYTYYTGVNICDSLNRSRKYIYDSSKESFIPQFSAAEIRNTVREYDEYLAGGGTLSKFGGKYRVREYDFMKQLLEEHPMTAPTSSK